MYGVSVMLCFHIGVGLCCT